MMKENNKSKKIWIILIAVCAAFFLLISFFVITTSLSKPQSMELGVVEDGELQKEKISMNPKHAKKAITILVGDNNKIISYVGPLSSPLEKPKEFEYGENGIRKELLRLKSTLSEEGKDGRIVLIKMSKKTSYKNMVDILDEMAIAKVPTYALVDITPEEMKLLESNK
ncbi:biopolymer transporter ExbD [Flavobacterium amniphilum]|uniref:ExbD/TolR family protein n=1 Tax=Flavobacterium amniphilum TaxID=1834035 RepID=UPI002029C10D|nr:biopolymer transporter ExbD [Flavobacterium amniphilum]MCL9805719.1 biopolymer transporter ExbD [Flavobacterium amniphilum]